VVRIRQQDAMNVCFAHERHGISRKCERCISPRGVSRQFQSAM
jgi:hypothetical protein